VKQSGGHGQYAVVVLEVAPGPPGSGIVFATRVVGGAVPTAFHASVEKGVRAQAERGTTQGRPLVDVVATLVDGKAHSVDSSDAAFQFAGALALREAAAAAGTVVLEPWSEVDVHLPAAFVGSVMSDLRGRRARVTGSENDSEDPDRAVVHAQLPDASWSATRRRSGRSRTGPGRSCAGRWRGRRLKPDQVRADHDRMSPIWLGPSAVATARVRRLSGDGVEERAAVQRVEAARVAAPKVVPRPLSPVALRLMALQLENDRLRAELEQRRAVS